MWWTLSFIIAITAIFLIVLIARKFVTDQRRSANWNNLHERGKLITTQLTAMRDAAARKEGPESPHKLATKGDAPTKEKLYWPRQMPPLRPTETGLFTTGNPVG